MNPNVFITVRAGSRVIDSREGHNVWVDDGREALANLLAYSSIGPDIPETIQRPKFMGFGIGSVDQTDPSVDIPPFSVSYPVAETPTAGFTPAGKQYNHESPREPPIEFIERPVRISGGVGDYIPPAPGDVWLKKIDFITHSSTTTVVYRTILDAGAGDIAYGSFTIVPLTEVALFLSGASVAGVPFQNPVAYYNFTPLKFASPYTLEVIWTVGF